MMRHAGAPLGSMRRVLASLEADACNDALPLNERASARTLGALLAPKPAPAPVQVPAAA